MSHDLYAQRELARKRDRKRGQLRAAIDSAITAAFIWHEHLYRNGAYLQPIDRSAVLAATAEIHRLFELWGTEPGRWSEQPAGAAAGTPGRPTDPGATRRGWVAPSSGGHSDTSENKEQIEQAEEAKEQ